MDLAVVYFSGTGNTKYAAERLFSKVSAKSKVIYSIEDNVDFCAVFKKATDIMLLYPICGGNMPIIMRIFLNKHRADFWGKGLITVVTEAGFSGDGGALAYRYLDSEKMTFKGSEHIYMPTNVSFGKLFAIKNGDALLHKIERVNSRLDRFADDINSGKIVRRGMSKFAYIMGYHLQRKYFEKMEPELVKKFAVDNAKCIRCQKCISLCPMHNIVLDDDSIKGLGNCTLCYRCLHACPTNSITLIRHENVQYKGIEDGLR